MKDRSIFSINFQWAFFLALSLGLLLSAGCKKDDEQPTPEKPIASFQYEISSTNFLEVNFTNFSQNATSYQWDFGDGGTSTDKDPGHVYAAAGEYTVILTASNASGETAKREEKISLTDPDELLTRLAGANSKTWYLMREGIALGIGPGVNDNQWWSFGGVTPLGDRPCVLDDRYIFHRDGRFEFNSNGTLYVDAAGDGGWLGPDETGSCHDESEPGVFTAADGTDVSAFGNGGDYTFDLDGANNTLTLLGEGAYIGLAQKTALGDDYHPISEKEYTIFNFAEGDIADSLHIAIVGNGFAWNFYLVSYKNPADLPEIPSSEPRADFTFERDGLTVDFTNTSANAASYAWDFGDGMISAEENPSHTYGAEGTYTVTLTVMDNNGNMDAVSKDVVVSSAAFTAAALSSADGKIWRLDGANSYYVGPSIGSGEWWGGITGDDVAVRGCQMDDEFIFFDGGTFEYDAKGQVWAEDFMLGSFACTDESSLQAPYDVLGSGMHAFEVMEAGGDDRAMLTVIGQGAFLGFPKGFNGGELNGTVAPAGQIRYEVLEYSAAGGTEILVVSVDISAGQDGTAWWTMRLRSGN